MLNLIVKKTIIILWGLAFCLSLLLNFWLAYQLFTLAKAYETEQMNAKILSFMGMFTENVLLANKEIDFDTRLELETAVRSVNDEEIFAQWQRFTKSTEKSDASNQVKILLNLLVKKIKK